MAFGGLERTPPQRPMSEINVTPLVDVMMVLLVIFILTAPFMVSSLKLDLPKAEASAATAPARALRLALNAQGEVFLDAQPVAREALPAALAQRAQQAREREPGALPEVQLQADAQVPYGQVVEVMAVAQQAGLTRIAFVTERPAQGATDRAQTTAPGAKAPVTKP